MLFRSTAYLKYFYPVEFMAALLTSVMGNASKIAQYTQDCKKKNIVILSPSVNFSEAKFTVEGKKIRFGLLAIKNVGIGVIEAIIKARKNKGIFISFVDFCEKVEASDMNKRAIESLIKAGAFDDLGANRAQLMAVYEKVLEGIQQDRRRNLNGQYSMFQSYDEVLSDTVKDDILPNVAEFQSRIRLAMEKEVLGLYISGHPLAELENEIKMTSTMNTGDFLEAEDELERLALKDGT